MRIFHLVPNLNYGGLQKVVQLLALRQIQSGHSVTIASWSNDNNHPEAERELERAGARILYPRRGPNGRMAHGRKYSLLKLKTYLGAGNADILHVHNPFEYYIYGALAAHVARTTKIVITIHATVMFDHPGFGSKGRAQFRIAAMLTHGLVSVCAESDAYLRNRFFLPGKKLFVVDNGIDMTPFLTVADRSPRDEIVFGCAGRMSPEKNHRILIEAFALARRKYCNIRLRLLGGGQLEEQLKERVHTLGLDDAVEFCGFSNDVPGFLSSLDIFILPSDSEAMPLCLIEAIASGLPVVSTTVGGAPSILKNTDGGWLCEPKNADAMLSAMELAISDPDRGERTKRARKMVAELYSAERMAAEYEIVYTSLIHREKSK
jgi:glycosyltransferase involved in cell wall biosynthesis